MAGKLRIVVVCLMAGVALSGLATAGAQASRVEWSSPVTLETPAGPASCAATPEAPAWAEVLTKLTPMKLTAEILGASALQCTIPTYGAVEIAGGGFPWHLMASVKKREGRLRGTKKLILEVTLLSLGAKCVYESSKVTGALSGESPALLSYSAPKVKLNTTRSFFLCPAGGAFSGSIPLP